MFLCAPETKGRTLEEMDDVFDSGLPAWKAGNVASRFDQITRDIEKGEMKAGSTHEDDVVVETKV